jgi:hypothetical protein
MPRINFKTDEIDTIAKVVDRVQQLEGLHLTRDERRSRSDWVMDFCAVQNSDTPLDLQRMLEADDNNFAHDAFGIARHLDRDDSSPTGGQLTGCFLPRFTRKDALAD